MSRWFITAPIRAALPARRLRLFAFPHAGRGASLFFPWRAGLPSWIELIAVQLPGPKGASMSRPWRGWTRWSRRCCRRSLLCPTSPMPSSATAWGRNAVAPVLGWAFLSAGPAGGAAGRLPPACRAFARPGDSDLRQLRLGHPVLLDGRRLRWHDPTRQRRIDCALGVALRRYTASGQQPLPDPRVPLQMGHLVTLCSTKAPLGD
jgi:hypothetical protein